MKYKIIAGGYSQGSYSDEAQAIHAARKLSYSYPHVLVRRIHANGHPVKHADDMKITGNTITY